MGRRVLREGPFTAEHRMGTEEWWLTSERECHVFMVTPRDLPALLRLVQRLQGTRRGDMKGSDADPKQKRCSQCGKPFTARACGPTHAAVAASRERLQAASAKGKRRG